MIQSEEILADLHSVILQAMLLTGVQALKGGVKAGATLAKRTAPKLAEKSTILY